MVSERSIKITRFCAYALYLIVVFIFQTVFAHEFEVFGIAPMVLIPATISAGIFGGIQTGMIFGLVLGLACDATSSVIFGYYALILMTIGLLAGFLIEYVAWRRLLAQLLILFACYFVMYSISLVWKLFILGASRGILYYTRDMAIEFLYTAIYAVPCYYISKFIYKRYFNEDD